MAVLAGGAAALLFILWLILRLLGASIAEQGALTDQVDVEIVRTAPETWGTTGMPNDGHRLWYRYEHGGETWGHQTRLTDTQWQVGQPLDACVDPDDGARHAIRIFDLPCGEAVNTGVATADRM